MLVINGIKASSRSCGSEPQLVPLDDRNYYGTNIINPGAFSFIPAEVSFASPSHEVKEDIMFSTVQNRQGKKTSVSKKRGRPSDLEQNLDHWKKVCKHVVREYQCRKDRNLAVNVSAGRNSVITEGNKKRRQSRRNNNANQNQVLTSQDIIQEQQTMNGMIMCAMKNGELKANQEGILQQCFVIDNGDHSEDAKKVNEEYTTTPHGKNQQICRWEGCSKRIVHGGLPFCTTHGGGLRCKFPGCKTNARAGGNLYCTRHGGGNRCKVDSCSKGAASGGKPFCINHGGGRRCQYTGCQKGAQGDSRSKFCRNHGRLLDGTNQ